MSLQIHDISTFTGIIQKAQALLYDVPFRKARLPETREVVTFQEYDLAPSTQAWAIRAREVFGRPFGARLLYGSYVVAYASERRLPIHSAEIRWRENGGFMLRSSILMDPNDHYEAGQLTDAQLSHIHAYLSLPMALIGIEEPAHVRTRRKRNSTNRRASQSAADATWSAYGYED